MAATDEQLWREAVDGDGDAFGLLFERHARAVYNFCFRRTGSWSLAEDLTSEVFLVAWRRRARVVFTDDVVGRLADERRMADVLAVFDRLSVAEQEVLALCAWADLSYEECALALGIPTGTVRSRLSRARVHLRELVACEQERPRERALGRCAS